MRASLYSATVCLLVASCGGSSGEIFTPLDTGPCPAAGIVGRLAEWNANGDLRNVGLCPSWQAQMAGTVPYGAGRNGQAWWFRSQQTSTEADPNYINVNGAAGAVVPELTVDVWVRQTSFNAYVGSNRFIASSRGGSFGNFTPGDWSLYVHESREVFFFVKVGPTYVQHVDWHTCFFNAQSIPLLTWLRFTATYDGATIRCYRDGRFTNSSPLPALASGPMGGLVIGRNYPGDVDALRIFNRVLSTAEIAQPWPQ